MTFNIRHFSDFNSICIGNLKFFKTLFCHDMIWYHFLLPHDFLYFFTAQTGTESCYLHLMTQQAKQKWLNEWMCP